MFERDMPSEKLFETESYTAEGIVEENKGISSTKYHIWIYAKSPSRDLTEDQIKEIVANLKDFGKWKKFKKLKQELEGKEEN
jgi:hypothetical protein